MPRVAQPHTGFDGLLVGAFESRLAAEMSRLIEAHGGRPMVAPSMREIPLEENREALEFGDRLLAGHWDHLLLLPRVRLKTLVTALETRHPRARIVEALGKVTRVCRGPKPVSALKALGLSPGITVPEPNTWMELLRTLDEKSDVAGRRVALQAIADAQVPVVLFTNANQVENVMQVARDAGLDARVRAALARGVVASVGPIASESLRNHGLGVDVEPPHPKMGPLVKEASLRCHAILEAKRDPGGGGAGGGRGPASRGGSGPGAGHGPSDRKARGAAMSPTGAVAAIEIAPQPARPGVRGLDPLLESPFMRACRRDTTSVTPVWLMRQAGRYMREYRQIRARRSFLEICRDPDLVTQITVYAVERLRVDSAI